MEKQQFDQPLPCMAGTSAHSSQSQTYQISEPKWSLCSLLAIIDHQTIANNMLHKPQCNSKVVSFGRPSPLHKLLHGDVTSLREDCSGKTWKHTTPVMQPSGLWAFLLPHTACHIEEVSQQSLLREGSKIVVPTFFPRSRNPNAQPKSDESFQSIASGDNMLQYENHSHEI